MFLRSSLILFSLFGLHLNAAAWQCASQSASQQIEAADIIFLGDVITERTLNASGQEVAASAMIERVDAERYTIETEFSIDRILKGADQIGTRTRLRVTQDVLIGSAAVYFVNQGTSLIFAKSSDAGGFSTHLCMLPQHALEDYRLF